jgi:hypothetical protein
MSTWLGGDRSFRRVFVVVAVAGLLLGGGAYALRGERIALSALVGTLLGLSNLYILARIVAVIAVPHEDAKSNGASTWGIIALGKLMALTGIMWLLMTRHLVDPIGLVVGYGALPIGIAIGGVVSDKTDPETPEEPPAP